MVEISAWCLHVKLTHTCSLQTHCGPTPDYLAVLSLVTAPPPTLANTTTCHPHHPPTTITYATGLVCYTSESVYGDIKSISPRPPQGDNGWLI